MIKSTTRRTKKGVRLLLVTVMLMLLFTALISPFKHSEAAHRGTDASLADTDHFMELWSNSIVNILWPLQLMTEQLVSTVMHQTFIIGTLMDARVELETQRLLQEMMAEAHTDYHPDVQMCVFGTNVRSLARADIYGREQARLFNETMLRRETMKHAAATAGGVTKEYGFRRAQFKNVYCNLQENNAGMALFCDGTSGPLGQVSKDVNFTRTVDGPYTLNIDFTDTALTDDERDVMALTRYLFAHRTFEEFPEDYLQQRGGKNVFLDTRTIHALRGVSHHSFSKLVGMRAPAEGTAVEPFMRRIMVGLEMEDEAITEFLGDNPSYYAQMEVLTRKLYQNPAFYTNLYTTPPNVKRTGVALQAISLMQDRDRFESALRREMLVSLILETNLREYQAEVSSRLRAIVPALSVSP